ncbi:MAG: tetratricopeptide repeat protein [Acidobacteria bacterium]|nr:tetratricopeptide repeat protein [Acidobacteriota bacterium]
MVEEVEQQAARMGALRAVALCRCFSGALRFQTGEWDEAETELREAVELYRQVDGASGESLSLQRLGVLLTARGKLDEALDLLHEGTAAAERATMRSHCLTRLYASMVRNRLAAGDQEAAVQAMHQGASTAERHGHCVTCNALLLPEAVRIALIEHDVDLARDRVGELDRIATEFGSTLWRAMADQSHARLHAANGSDAEAELLFRQAADAFLEAEAPYEAARALTARARLLDKSSNSDTALRCSNLANEIYRRVGAPGIEN